MYGLHYVALRYANVYGPRQNLHGEAGVVAIFAERLLRGEGCTIYGDGGQTRDFTYVENVVDANFRACFAPGEGVVGEVFNVGCGERISMVRLWEEIRDILGVELDAVAGPPRPGDVRDSLADLTKIRARLGYEVRVPLAEGLRRTVAWVREMRAGGGSATPSDATASGAPAS
jgi:nucleoside-diphosphate-sugar epimerase